MDVPSVSVNDLQRRLGFAEALDYPSASLRKPLTQWRMEDDDAPIFRYLYRNARPKRHLEFGTWQGTGTLYCLEECDATVWTINLLEGESSSDGSWAYSTNVPRVRKGLVQRILGSKTEDLPGPGWANYKTDSHESIGYQTDSLGFIGKNYLERGLGKRVCQIYADSRQWNIDNYPEGFFDSALIDGGHTSDVVANDTDKACKLVRSGGMVLWHDFCPDPEVLNECSSPRGVLDAIRAQHDLLKQLFNELFWIRPSWILLGRKR